MTLSQMLPPKRDLPFPTKKSPLPAKEPEPEPENTKKADPKPSPAQLQVEGTPPKVAKKRKSRAKTTKTKTPAKAPKPAYRAILPQTLSAPPRINTAVLAESNGNQTNSDSQPGPSRRISHRPTAVRQVSPISEDIPSDEIMSRLDDWVRKYQDLPAPKAPVTAAENLAAYAAQPEEERLVIIDNMICECLGDENFIKLTEDVEKSWRRIGLGF